jgi:hypothetical protein
MNIFKIFKKDSGKKDRQDEKVKEEWKRLSEFDKFIFVEHMVSLFGLSYFLGELRQINSNAPNGEGHLYNFYMPEGEDTGGRFKSMKPEEFLAVRNKQKE